MATLVLSAAGAAIGGSIGGGIIGVSSAVIGRAVGAAIGNTLDQRLLGSGSGAVSSSRVDTFRIMSGAEGAAVPRIFGSVRIGGQVIWASRFREEQTTSGGGKNRPSVTSYTYSVSLAIALCEGPVERIGRVWADGNEIALDTINWRLHRGLDDQEPDALIQAIEGAENVPAYRGTAYVVFEDLALAQFGHRVPQFNFEVVRRVATPESAGGLADPFTQIKGVALVPGTGEYALATQKVHLGKGTGSQELINVNNALGEPDIAVSLDNLAVEMPQVDHVSLVVGWFGTDLRCNRCQISPRVERREVDGTEMPWRVSGVSRINAPVMTQIDGRPSFGGTPTDASVVQAITRMKADGKGVLFYPFLMMDIPNVNLSENPWTGGGNQPAYPWRGRITLNRAPGVAGTADKTPAAASEVDAFFGTAALSDFQIVGNEVHYNGPHEWSYRRFILHYAYLCQAAGGVAAFAIGSEMRSLTQIRDGLGSFPAVRALVQLAADVRSILGNETKITYAADWSEYFGYHPADGLGDVFFHLDELWASDNIDAIGIDNYMPLSDWRDGTNHADAANGSIYDLDYLQSNVAGGEGFDWYYINNADRDLQIRSQISDGAYDEPWVYRYKDILNWWRQAHYNRPGGIRAASPTAWVPESKPIWFTELGCPAIDKGTNQPNVFYDDKSSESEVPYYSTSARDDYIQHRYFQAHFQHWGDVANNPVSTVYGAPMVDMDQTYVWAWDARPWPEFPDRLSVWSDGVNYGRGHWISGRLSGATLAGVVGELAEQSGFSDYDVSGLNGAVTGFVLDDTQTARASLQPLMLAHAFDAYETDGKIVFANRSVASVSALNDENLAEEQNRPPLHLTRDASGETPTFVQVGYLQASDNYQAAASIAGAPSSNEEGRAAAELPIVMTSAEGSAIAARWLSEASIAQDSAEITLPPSSLHVTPGDVIELEHAGQKRLYRVDTIEEAGVRRVGAVRCEQEVYQNALFDERAVERPSFSFPAPGYAQLLDLPLIGDETKAHAPYVALTSVPWLGRHSVYSGALGSNLTLDGDVVTPSVMGATAGALPRQIPGLWAAGGVFRVQLVSGELSSQTRTAVLNGANLAALKVPGAQDWELFQFQTATLVGDNTYALDGLLRGQFGTDVFMPETYPIGSEFVLVEPSLFQSNLPSAAFGSQWQFRAGPASRPIDDESFVSVVGDINGAGLRPLAPVHLAANPDGGGGFTIEWKRQTRVGGDNWVGPDVPLGEDAEAYILRILKPGFVIPERSFTTPGYALTAAAMAEHALTPPFDVEVAQLSQTYGYGPFRRITIDG